MSLTHNADYFFISTNIFLTIVSPRRRLSQIQLVRGPNKILLTLADVTFINPSLSNKVIVPGFYANTNNKDTH